MATYTLKLSNQSIRAKAHLWVDNAPEGMVVKFQDPNRSIDQNAKMWAMHFSVAIGADMHQPIGRQRRE